MLQGWGSTDPGQNQSKGATLAAHHAGSAREPGGADGAAMNLGFRSLCFIPRAMQSRRNVSEEDT